MESDTDLNLFSEVEVLPEIKFCIVIPIKNEEYYIENALSAFINQKDLDGDPINLNTFEILVLANNCSDRSVEIIKEFQNKNPQLNIFLEEISLPIHQANIGFVRKNLMDTAYKRLQRNGGGLLLTTDADTTVAEDWISQNYFEIENCADAVGGRILLHPNEIADLDAKTYANHLKDEEYQMLIAELETIILESIYDPLPRHHQHFNGSFAVTTDCYLRSGGVPDVTHLEDMAFFECLNLIDAKVRHSNTVVVHTSARCIGRTEIGLSHQMNIWKNLGTDGSQHFVESFQSIMERFNIKKQLKKVWEMKEHSLSEFRSQMHKISSELLIDEQDYLIYKKSEYFGKWYSHLLEKFRDVSKQYPLELIDDAISKLENEVSNYICSNVSQTSIR